MYVNSMAGVLCGSFNRARDYSFARNHDQNIDAYFLVTMLNAFVASPWS